MLSLLYANRINSRLSEIVNKDFSLPEPDINNNCAQVDAMENKSSSDPVPQERGLTNSDLKAKLILANTKIQSLEARLTQIEQSARMTVEQQLQHSEEMMKQSKIYRNENNTQKQMYLACLKEIEQKTELVTKKYTEATKENKSLRTKIQELIESEKLLREEVYHLKLSLKTALDDRNRIYDVLKIKTHEGSKGFGTVETEEFYWRTTEKAQALLNRQKETKIKLVAPSLPQKYPDPRTSIGKILSHTKLGAGEDDEILRELFFIS